MAIERPNISEMAAEQVRAMIVDGALPEGERINEVHLAAHLGVSRTPLREALNRLAAEGAIVARPRLGYLVKPFSLDDLQQIYTVRPILDPAALKLAGIPAPKAIAELEALNKKLAAERDPRRAIDLDDAWHLKLLAGCPNRVLVEMIENIILRTRRYELALFRETKNVMRASDDHARILTALRKGDLDKACAALKGNMESGLPPLAAWLKAREAKAQKGKRT